MAHDVIIRNGRVVLRDEVAALAIGISDGRIETLAPEIDGPAACEIDAAGQIILPALIDAHVHFNEPGRTHWEGFASGSAAIAAGGGACFMDMPLNASPPTIDGAAFDAKLAAASRHSLTDFGLWGGLVPGNLDRLDELAARGVVGLKAFMADSGIDDFNRADDLTLLEGMHRAAKLGLLVAVHAESEALTSALTRRARESGRVGMADYLASRPVVAELEAIERVVVFAKETGCRLHIVHISHPRGIRAVAAARAEGVDITCETCPHYLVLSADEMESLGVAAKCAPPLRHRADARGLWQAAMNNELQWIASDHSPSPPEMKENESFFDAWGGIAGCQSTLPLLMLEGHQKRGMPLTQLARLIAGAPAERFRLHGKGAIEIGRDADLTLVDPAAGRPLRAEDLFYRHRQSPYLGRPIHGMIRRTLVRGRTVFADGKATGEQLGRLVSPARPPNR